jgi:hypothetical protein
VQDIESLYGARLIYSDPCKRLLPKKGQHLPQDIGSSCGKLSPCATILFPISVMAGRSASRYSLIAISIDHRFLYPYIFSGADMAFLRKPFLIFLQRQFQ